MSNDRLAGTTQQMLLALLCCDQVRGAEIGMQLQPKHFDGVHKDIATAVFQYRSKYNGKPPGRKNLPVIIENLPLQHERLETARHEAREILKLDKLGFNKDYIVSLGLKFAKFQNFKEGMLEATDLVAKANVDNVEEIEQVLYRTLRNQPNVITPGVRLSDDNALAFLERYEDGYSFGLRTLDDVGLLMKRGELILYIGPKNSGKSWACIHIGRTCVLQGARVLHISLEMNRDQVLKRYFQNWFALATTNKEIVQAELKVDAKKRASNWKVNEHLPTHTLSDGNIRKTLKRLINVSRGLDRLMVVDFPTGSLTVNQLENYLDALAMNEQFVPDVVIIDYPDLMNVSRRDYRLALGELYVHLRGLAVRRQITLFTPTQSNREGIGSKKVSSTNVGEDISKIFTADTVLTYSQTKLEQEAGLARLTLEHARDVAIGSEILLVQNYATGQYVCDEALVSSEYMKRIKKMNSEAEGGGTEPEGLIGK